jgi:hypothetical protein
MHDFFLQSSLQFQRTLFVNMSVLTYIKNYIKSSIYYVQLINTDRLFLLMFKLRYDLVHSSIFMCYI